MKNWVLLLAICSLANSAILLNADDCSIKATSHSFFSVRPQFQTASPERVTLFRDRIGKQCDGYHGAIQIVPLGGQSGQTDLLARFFLPFDKCSLDVASIELDNKKLPPDIMSQQFGIYPEAGQQFKSTISIEPRQSIAGVGITYRQAFLQLPDSNNYVWFEISSPIISVENKVCLKEKVDPNNGKLQDHGLPQNMTQAFKQESWLYGKIDNEHRMRKTGLADIELKFGYEWLKRGCCFLESYIGLLIPTGNCPKARYMFEPIIGHNKHMGLFFGNTGVFEFWHCEPCCDFFFALDMNALYLADRIERRSFDLKYRPWSRYMQVYANKEQAELALSQRSETLHTPGINVFTQDMCVSPRMAKTINSALIITRDCLQAELGYNFYARDAENVKLKCCWNPEPALKNSLVGGGQTNPYQTINWFVIDTAVNNEVFYYTNNVIKASDLDLESAAHPAVLTQTIYATLGYSWDCKKYPCFAGLGASYEAANDNVGLNRWLVWGKCGISF